MQLLTLITLLSKILAKFSLKGDLTARLLLDVVKSSSCSSLTS